MTAEAAGSPIQICARHGSRLFGLGQEVAAGPELYSLAACTRSEITLPSWITLPS
jgi:hypothetical protein